MDPLVLRKRPSLSLTEAVLKLRTEYIFPFYCVISLFRLVRRGFVPLEYVKRVVFTENCEIPRILSVLQSRPRLKYVNLVNCRVNDAVLRQIASNHRELNELTTTVNIPLDFNDFCGKLSVNSNCLKELSFIRSYSIDDAAVNCVLMHFPNLTMLHLFECSGVQKYPTVPTTSLLVFENCPILDLKDVVVLLFHNMKCGKPLERIERSVKVYFSDNEMAWNLFERYCFRLVLAETEEYRFCSHTFETNHCVLNMVCAVTSTDFIFFRVARYPYPRVYHVRLATKEAGRKFCFYETMWSDLYQV